jgi:hypothetical protein
VDAGFWEEIERNRHIPGGQKMTEGLRLFDEESHRMLEEIKQRRPELNDDEARRIRNERLDRIRRWEQWG